MYGALRDRNEVEYGYKDFVREWNEACNMIKSHNKKAECDETQIVIRTSSGYSRRYKNV